MKVEIYHELRQRKNDPSTCSHAWRPPSGGASESTCGCPASSLETSLLTVVVSMVVSEGIEGVLLPELVDIVVTVLGSTR